MYAAVSRWLSSRLQKALQYPSFSLECSYLEMALLLTLVFWFETLLWAVAILKESRLVLQLVRLAEDDL